MTHGICVRDGFLPPLQIREVTACADARDRQGDFGLARVGAGQRLQTLQHIRGDSTCWLEPPLLDAERSLLGDLEGLRLDLNREAFLGLFDLELHYARYPPGAGYARHVDQPQGRDRRKLSVIVYLNEFWRHGDGGELRVFDTAGEGYRDIAPIGGRLVYFLTEGREHAVLPTRIGRSSISGWFRSR